MYRTYTVRLFPTKEQEQCMLNHIYATKFIWNWALAYQQTHYNDTHTYITSYTMCNLVTQLKREPGFEWLLDISKATLQQTLIRLGRAFTLFFKGTMGFPKFKKKKDIVQSFITRGDNKALYFTEKTVRIQKIGNVKYRTNYKLPLGNDKRFYEPTITYRHGKWILNVKCTCENQVAVLTNNVMGIDLGIKNFATIAFGTAPALYIPSIYNNKRIKYLESKLGYLQTRLNKSRLMNNKLTKNGKKLKQKIAKIMFRLHNIRLDFVHKLSYTLVHKLPKAVVMESLFVNGLCQKNKSKHMRHIIVGQRWGLFIELMKYKCENLGISFIKADRFFPSSKRCSSCGAIKSDLALHDRVYYCPKCGLKIDRDYNAALNLASLYSN